MTNIDAKYKCVFLENQNSSDVLQWYIINQTMVHVYYKILFGN